MKATTTSSSSSSSNAISSEIAQLESRMKSNLTEVRSSLKTLYSASSSVAQKDHQVGPQDATLQLYIKVKSDTRALLTYYRDVAMRAPARPAITIANNTVSIAPGDKTKPASTPARSSHAADDLLVEFESAFDLRDEGLPPEQQRAGRTEVVLLRRVSDMHAVMINTVYKLINAAFEQLGIDHIVSETHLPPNLETCSRELPMVFHFLRTFRSLGKTAEMVKAMGSQAEAQAEARRQQIQVEQLTLDVQARLVEIFDLRKRLDAAALQTERQNTIVRQQDHIATLEKVRTHSYAHPAYTSQSWADPPPAPLSLPPPP